MPFLHDEGLKCGFGSKMWQKSTFVMPDKLNAHFGSIFRFLKKNLEIVHCQAY